MVPRDLLFLEHPIRLRCRTVAALAASLVPVLLAAQQPPAGARTYRYALVGHWGRALGGPGSALATQLRNAGFADRTPEVCSGGPTFLFPFPSTCSGDDPTPRQWDGGRAGGGELFRNTGNRLALGVGYATTHVGGAFAYQSSGRFISSRWRARTMWAAIYWRPIPTARIGGGPAWYRMSPVAFFVPFGRQHQVEESPRTSVTGAFGELAIELPFGGAGTSWRAVKQLFLDVAARHHFVPTARISYGEAPAVVLEPAWSHTVVSVGLGLRM